MQYTFMVKLTGIILKIVLQYCLYIQSYLSLFVYCFTWISPVDSNFLIELTVLFPCLIWYSGIQSLSFSFFFTCSTQLPKSKVYSKQVAKENFSIELVSIWIIEFKAKKGLGKNMIDLDTLEYIEEHGKCLPFQKIIIQNLLSQDSRKLGQVL